MKNSKIVNARYLVMTLMILAGVTVSCEKEDITNLDQEHKGRVIVLSEDSERGGDDDEDPIVRGIVENGNGNPVENADVKLFEVGSTTPTAGETSDVNGEFTMSAPVGTYYFKVVSGGVTTITNSFGINGDMSITIII